MSSLCPDPARLLSTIAGAFDPSELKGHFVLGRSVSLTPDGWATRSLLGWNLAHAPDLEVVDITDAAGERIGWLLGAPLRLGDGPVHDTARLPFDASISDFEERFEGWLYDFGGPFTAVLLASSPRVYIDPFSALPVLFDKELELVSSSPFLLTRDGTVPDAPLQEQLDIGTGLWFILGTTPHARAERLLPNHALSLDTWEARRHWPTHELSLGDPAELTEEIADLLTGTMEAVTKTARPSVSLTAGGDTRTILACSRSIVDRLQFFTVAFPDGLGTTDLRTAPRIASRFGLDYRRLEWVPPSQRDTDFFLYQTGCMIGELRGQKAAPTYAQLDRQQPYVAGVGGVVGVSAGDVRLTPRKLKEQRLDGRELVGGFRWPLLPVLVERADRWLAELPPLDFVNTHFLFQIEMYYGCWGGPLALAFPDACSSVVYPYAQRSVIESVMRMPSEHRTAGGIREQVIASRWPELLDIPLNSAPLSVIARRRAARARAIARAGGRRIGRKLRGLDLRDR